MAIGSQRAYRVVVDGPGIRLGASRLSGIERSGAVREVWNGGATAPELINGRPSWSNCTIGMPYDPARMQATVLALLKSHVGKSESYTISRQDLDGNGVKIGKAMAITGCRLVRVLLSDYDEESDEPAYLTLEFKPQNVA